jgi:G3E family GTPase
VVLLNKTDLVSPDVLDELERRIRGMNALAKIYRTRNAELSMDALLGIGAFDLERHWKLTRVLSETAHEHDETVGSVAIVEVVH